MIRAAVLYFGRPAAQVRLKALAEALAEGMRRQGAQVDVWGGAQARDVKLTGYHYLAIGCDVRSFWKGDVPPELPGALANAGIITGKKSFAFVLQAPLGTGKTLTRLMRALEHEGMHLRFSETFARPEEARGVGERLKLD